MEILTIIILLVILFNCIFIIYNLKSELKEVKKICKKSILSYEEENKNIQLENFNLNKINYKLIDIIDNYIKKQGVKKINYIHQIKDFNNNIIDSTSIIKYYTEIDYINITDYIKEIEKQGADLDSYFNNINNFKEEFDFKEYYVKEDENIKKYGFPIQEELMVLKVLKEGEHILKKEQINKFKNIGE
jgi:hypothetical protein